MCRVEFCLIFSTFSVPASGAVNSWSIFHQENGAVFSCDLMSLTDRLRHRLKAQCPCSFFLFWEQEKQQTLHLVEHSQVPPTGACLYLSRFLRLLPAKLSRTDGDGMTVIVTPRGAHGAASALTTDPHTTGSAGVAAEDLKLGLIQFFALCH